MRREVKKRMKARQRYGGCDLAECQCLDSIAASSDTVESEWH
jgi:hypothetical protein